jgi:hypothetical protein
LFPVLQGKAGHLQTEMNINSLSDFDDCTMWIANIIARLDESYKQYLEEREVRLACTRQENNSEKKDQIATNKPLKRARPRNKKT